MEGAKWFFCRYIKLTVSSILLHFVYSLCFCRTGILPIETKCNPHLVDLFISYLFRVFGLTPKSNGQKKLQKTIQKKWVSFIEKFPALDFGFVFLLFYERQQPLASILDDFEPKKNIYKNYNFNIVKY